MRALLLPVVLGLLSLHPVRAAAASAAAPGDEPSLLTAFVGVTVVPMVGEAELADHTVLVRGDRIEAVGPSASVTVPDGATLIDGRGGWLMPGLADMHVHTWSPDDFPLFLAHGVTTVRCMFGTPLQLGWRAQIEAGELAGPTILTAGPIIDGDPPTWPGSTVLTDPAQAEAVVLAQQAAGYDFLKPYARLSADCYDALVTAAKQHGMRFMGHVPASVGLERVIAAGQSSIEHLDGLAAAAQSPDSPLAPVTSFFATLQAWEHVDDARVAELAARCAEADVWNCPTLVVLQKWVGPGEAEAQLARPEMAWVAPAVKRFWRPENNYLSRMTPELLEQVRAGDADRRRCVGVLHAAGARILAGTDTGNPFVVPGVALHDELANLVASGLSPREALRAATSGAAEFMGQSAEWGSVEPGRRADLLLLEADPLADVGHAARRAGVMVRGHWLDAAGLDAQLAELAARHAPAPAEPPAPK
jgi:imidazolonepropionase-like amidohydrolase